MAAAVTVLDSFLSSAYDLPRETHKKVFKALRNFVVDPRNVGLHLERLNGRASHLWSIRVDDDYRIILRRSEIGTPVVLFVGTHDRAYRFAERGFPDELRCCNLAPADDLKSEIRGSLDPLSSMLDGLEGEGLAKEIAIEDLESMVGTRKYLPLARVFLQEEGDSVLFTFSQIETAIDDQLPPSARRHRAWWGNERGRHVQASCWLGVGWKVVSVDLTSETVTFARITK